MIIPGEAGYSTATLLVRSGACGGPSPASRYGYPNEMVYVIWAFTMLIPAYFALRGNRFDRRRVAAVYGLLAGLTGAGGQLLLFQALSNGPAYLIFPLVSLSPVITVLMAVALLRERIDGSPLGAVAALAAIVLFSISAATAGGRDRAVAAAGHRDLRGLGRAGLLHAQGGDLGINDGTIFGWMTISGLLLIPVALVMMAACPAAAPGRRPR